MGTKELLEQDRERVISCLAAAGSAEESAGVLDEELNRILYSGLQNCTDETQAALTRTALQTVRAAIPLSDSFGEAKVYEKVSGEDKGSGFLSLDLWQNRVFAVSAVSGLLAVALPAFSRGAGPMNVLGLLLMCVSVFCGIMAGKEGFLSKNGHSPDPGREQIVDIRLDPQKLYHHMDMLLCVVDETVAEVSEQVRQSGYGPGVEPGVQTEIPAEELSLFASLAEAAYGLSDRDEARQILSDLRYFLHRREVETVDYSPGTAAYFDLMPSDQAVTFRPAFVQNGELLCRGLAGELIHTSGEG